MSYQIDDELKIALVNNNLKKKNPEYIELINIKER